MKAILYCIILILVLFAPVNKQDIGDLEPIQAVWMYTENGKIALKTDTGDYGVGDTVQSAVQTMKQNSEGLVYLDTAQFLLVSKDAVEYIDEIMGMLKKSVKVCQWEGNDVLAAARYMQSHKMGNKIKELDSIKQLQIIPGFSVKEE